MKPLIVLSSILVLASKPTPTATRQLVVPEQITSNAIGLPSINHNAFNRGEKLTYEVSYGWLDAGEATIEITQDKKTIAGREVYHVVGLGNSKGAFNWFFKVKDRYETFLDVSGVFPWRFVRDIHEGGFELKQHYDFDQINQKVKTDKGKEFNVPIGVQDMISSFYRARAINFKGVKSGQIFEIPAFVDNELWSLKIKFLRKERITIERGTFDCMVFVPVVQTGRIFKEEEDMMVWVTDDQNKIPVLAKASVLVGSIKMELQEFEGLANPVAMR